MTCPCLGLKKKQKTLKNMTLNKFKNSLKHKQSLKKKQRGGQAPSCLTKSDISSKYMASCHTANIHNTNPEAAYSLIEGEGVLPTMKGGSSCTPIPTQAKPLTFTDYLLRTSKEISGGSGLSSNFDSNSLEMEKAKSDGHPQLGGSGFSINPEEMIGGLPGRAKYDSCCQPAVIGGKLVQGKGTDAICGNQMGGKRSSTKKRSSSKRNSKSNRAKSTKKRVSKSKNSKKPNKQSGGKPSEYPFKGENSNFDHLADNKDFSGKQPYWSVDTR